MKRAFILARPAADSRMPHFRPANDNDPPDPPPAASQRLPPLIMAIDALSGGFASAALAA